MRSTAPAPGSFGVVRTQGLVSSAIRLGTRSQVNHAFVVLDDGTVVESLTKGARISSLSDYDNYFVVYNDTQPLTDIQRAAIVGAARSLVGVRYSFWDIVVLALTCLGVRWRWAAKRVERMDRLICSQLVDRAYLLAEVHLFNDGRLSGSVTPGDLLLYTAAHAWDQV